jgi:hypothetical protein
MQVVKIIAIAVMQVVKIIAIAVMQVVKIIAIAVTQVVKVKVKVIGIAYIHIFSFHKLVIYELASNFRFFG